MFAQIFEAKAGIDSNLEKRASGPDDGKKGTYLPRRIPGRLGVGMRPVSFCIGSGVNADTVVAHRFDAGPSRALIPHQAPAVGIPVAIPGGPEIVRDNVPNPIFRHPRGEAAGIPVAVPVDGDLVVEIVTFPDGPVGKMRLISRIDWNEVELPGEILSVLRHI